MFRFAGIPSASHTNIYLVPKWMFYFSNFRESFCNFLCFPPKIYRNFKIDKIFTFCEGWRKSNLLKVKFNFYEFKKRMVPLLCQFSLLSRSVSNQHEVVVDKFVNFKYPFMLACTYMQYTPASILCFSISFFLFHFLSFSVSSPRRASTCLYLSFPPICLSPFVF